MASAKCWCGHAPTVSLGWDVRQKSRFDAVDSIGRRWGVVLPRGSVVRGGDVLIGEDGTLIAVQAAAQPLLSVTHCRQHGTPHDLLRAAYHLGNRHVALELRADCLLLEPDHVLADMLQKMQLHVAETLAPFEPEAGAYAAADALHAHGDHSHLAPQGGKPHAHSHGPVHRHGGH